MPRQTNDNDVQQSSVSINSNADDGIDDEVDRNKQQVSVFRHSMSTCGLCLCTLMQAYLLISVFPYAGYMVVDLMANDENNINVENAGTYAGLLASSFMAGRALSAYHWGIVADRYGRIFVLNASLVLSVWFSVLFGTSKTFCLALIWRFLLGLSNGIVATAKTAATEIAHGDEKLERRAMGLVVGMRGWGFLISPAIGGLLAEPLVQYPNVKWLQNSNRINRLLTKYPFLLPNLVGAFFCLLTAVAVTCFMEETLPKSKLRSPKLILCDLYQYARQGIQTRLCCFQANNSSNGGETQLLLRQTWQSKNDQEQSQKEHQGGSAKVIWSRKSTRKHIVAYCMFSFVVVAVDEAFPLFCMSRQGGLGLQEATIGKILSGAGLMFASCQYVVFSTIVNKFGLYPSITIGSIVGVPPVIFIPLSLVLNQGVPTSQVSWGTFFFLSGIMALSKVFNCLFFTSIAIASNKTVSSSQRATMNGIMMIGGSIAKGLGPTFAGALVAFCLSSGFIPPQYGAIAIYTVIAMLGVVVVFEVIGLGDEADAPAKENTAAPDTKKRTEL